MFNISPSEIDIQEQLPKYWVLSKRYDVVKLFEYVGISKL